MVGLRDLYLLQYNLFYFCCELFSISRRKLSFTRLYKIQIYDVSLSLTTTNENIWHCETFSSNFRTLRFCFSNIWVNTYGFEVLKCFHNWKNSLSRKCQVIYFHMENIIKLLSSHKQVISFDRNGIKHKSK